MRRYWASAPAPQPQRGRKAQECYRRCGGSSTAPTPFIKNLPPVPRVLESFCCKPPCFFRIRVCPRGSPFLMPFCPQLTSAALVRYCGRRFKVRLLHFTCVIASYDIWCCGVPLLAVARLLSVCFCLQTSRCHRRADRLTRAALVRDCGRRFKVRLLQFTCVMSVRCCVCSLRSLECTHVQFELSFSARCARIAYFIQQHCIPFACPLAH